MLVRCRMIVPLLMLLCLATGCQNEDSVVSALEGKGITVSRGLNGNVSAARFDQIPATGDDLKKVASLSSIQGVHASAPEVGDDIFAILAECPALSTIEITDSAATGKAVASLSKASNLKSLSLQNTAAIDDAAVSSLSGNTTIQSINLSGTKVTDASIETLSSMTSLTSLSLADTGVTDAGVQKLVEGWTTSCLMADLNSDGIDDLYDCQYAAGTEPFDRKCLSGPNGEERGCSPTLFRPESDRVLIGDGFGDFADQSISSDLTQATGRGLGLVLANLDEQPGLELFVSNDMTANHLWKITAPDQGVHFEEVGLSRGVASNGVGQVEASMGIAAADFSGDGRCDLVVTNFFEETNTFYQGQPAGFFRDQSQVSQLAACSLKLLGFGCQALDADLDSDFDLLLVNGHVDDYRHRDVPWKMKPSFFQNLGTAEFQLSQAFELGTYGQQPALGRACARLDFDRDGKPDAVVTHLDRHPALLQNQTADCGHSLTIRCVGNTSNRPAVGTELKAEIGQRVVSVQRVAGDGYFCSNEWNIVIGCGPRMKIDNLEVTWPSGHRQSFKNVSVNQRLAIVEGTDRLYEMRP